MARRGPRGRGMTRRGPRGQGIPALPAGCVGGGDLPKAGGCPHPPGMVEGEDRQGKQSDQCREGDSG